VNLIRHNGLEQICFRIVLSVWTSTWSLGPIVLIGLDLKIISLLTELLHFRNVP